LKNWQELNYKQFIRELNKSIKKTSIEKLSKLQEMEWMEIFETNIEESKNILYSIHRIDKEIDQLVYAIYQLSEKEIQLIENSQQ
jgi:DNA primase large subunit